MNSLALVVMALSFHCTDVQYPTQKMELTFKGNSVAVRFTDGTDVSQVASEEGTLSGPEYQTATVATFDLNGSHAYDCGRGVTLTLDQTLLSGATTNGTAIVSVAGNYGCADETDQFSCSR